ncbi:MAG: dihydroorotate dehydrogenase-like protein [Pirellulales bacterium]
MTVDLTTEYLGLTLRNPLVVAASPLSGQSHNLQRLEEAGAAAVVLGSLFAEQLQSAASEGSSAADATNFAVRPVVADLDDYNSGPDSYLRYIAIAKKEVTIPIIGSLNGSSRGQWVRFARLIEEAGADALEVNIYFVPTDDHASSQQVEERYLEIVAAIREQIAIPLAIKIGPFFTSLPDMARRLIEAGADGLVIFNRYLQPDINLDTLEIAPQLVLSSRDELRLALRWIGILSGQVSVSLAGTGGVHLAEDVLKVLLAGADVAMLASALIQHGPAHLTTLVEGTERWLDQKGYQSIAQIKGLVSHPRCADQSAYERANYTRMITSLTREAE